MATLDVPRFAELFGAAEAEVAAACADAIPAGDFRYAELSTRDRDETLLRVLRTLETPLPVSGRERLDRWEAGWEENLQAFRESADVEDLVPGYYRRGREVMRLAGRYVLPASERFEIDFLAVLQAWVGAAFLADAPHVYEFGCGPCHNLAALAGLYPDKVFHALDWASASQRIAESLAASLGTRIEGRRFDMFAPDPAVHLAPDAAVFTMGAMEQLGEKFDPFLGYLVEQSPVVCVHVEPIYELYDQATLFDWVAARYSDRRGYLKGFLPELRALEGRGLVRIQHVKKILGSVFHDGWTLVAWRPVRGGRP